MPIIRFRRAEGFRGFTGSLSLRPVELLVSLADLTGGFPPSQRRLLPPSFPTGRSPFPRSDITTVATEQAPPMGLSPIGTSASIAAQAPSLHRSYPLLHRRLQQLRCLRHCFDCYRVERSSSRAGIPPLWTTTFHGAPGFRVNRPQWFALITSSNAVSG